MNGNILGLFIILLPDGSLKGLDRVGIEVVGH